MSKCNLSIRNQEGGAVGGLAEGVIIASVICPSVNMKVDLFTDGHLQGDTMTN